MKKLLKRLVYGLSAATLLVGALILFDWLGGHQMGLFSGARPEGLGYHEGKFKPPSWKPNTVSSTVDKSDTVHWIEPLAITGDTQVAWKKLIASVTSLGGATIIRQDHDYLHVECKSAGLGFVDDLELALDKKAGVIHVRSASRLGVRDFGVNRERVEKLRAALGK